MGVVRMRVNRGGQSPLNSFSKLSARFKTTNIRIFHYIRIGKLIFFVSFDTCYITKHVFTETSKNSEFCGPLTARTLLPSASLRATTAVSGPQNSLFHLVSVNK